MNLFDEVALFDAGRKQFIDYGLPDTDLRLWEQFFCKDESDRYFTILKDNSPWQQRTRKMYDRMVADPRLTAFYGEPNGNEWTADLLLIKEKIESVCGVVFNRVLLNYYRDGNDSVAWHSDTLPADGRHHAIASVTFGETRVFKIRPNSKDNVRARTTSERCLDIPLTHGSFLLMGETMQDYYEHQIPKTARKIGARINLTFRVSEVGGVSESGRG